LLFIYLELILFLTEESNKIHPLLTTKIRRCRYFI